ncbi:hypothetical protein EET67_05065 [Pseudaminobacter arsenicus]|uniref:Uncharacterized protein n=1 Tax=Borborobacter arsenicus TaxID=1851146 RepID=A0A432VA02_9HYPH|nr:hypothetical protein [Pseudaminobacter arsenicus]RUM99012.1 hypothetical protein EET67_05065 [Pseudaminobacter arsenicus]
MIVLEGPREERTNAQARARIPMNAAQVRSVIDEMELHTKQKAARVSLAQSAIRVGNITDEGKAVYREYLRQVGA